MTAVIEAAPALTRALGVAEPAQPRIIDNAQYAWDNSTQYCLASLPEDFVSEYRDLLDKAAIAAIVPALRRAWAVRGFTVEFGSWEDLRSPDVERPLSDSVYHAVWDEAADALEGTSLVADAELNEELAGWTEAA
jgi:hypothetical protein